LHGDAAPTVLARGEEAGHRPDGTPIDRLQRARALEPGVRLARRHGDPGDRLRPRVREKAGRFFAPDEGAKRAAIDVPLALAPLGAAKPTPHAPAARAGAARSKELLEIVPAGRRGWNHADRGSL